MTRKAPTLLCLLLIALIPAPSGMAAAAALNDAMTAAASSDAVVPPTSPDAAGGAGVTGVTVTREYAQSRPFQGAVRRDMARQAAQAAAENMAFGQAMLLLAEHPALRFVSGGDVGAIVPPLAGIARMVYSVKTTGTEMRGFPPHVEEVARVALVPPPDLDEAVKKALSRRDLLELYERAAVLQADLVLRYDETAQKALLLKPGNGGMVEERLKLTGILKGLTALAHYLALLPGLEKSWKDPRAAHTRLARMLELAPDNPLIRTAMAEALLQLDRPTEALEHAGEALALDAHFARAHDVQGTILLRQRLPALAADAFSRAIAEAPSTPDYYAHRAAAHLVREEAALMCADFAKACALGICEGHAWAMGKQLCSEGALPPQTPPAGD